jgi:hypothetical protein
VAFMARKNIKLRSPQVFVITQVIREVEDRLEKGESEVKLK